MEETIPEVLIDPELADILLQITELKDLSIEFYVIVVTILLLMFFLYLISLSLRIR